MTSMKLTTVKKIIGLILCLVLFVGFIPSAVFASEEYTVYLGGNQMSASSDGKLCSYFVNGENAQSGTVTDSEPDMWNAKLWYDTANSRLCLELNGICVLGDANYSRATEGNSTNTADVKRCAGLYSDTFLYIIVKSENSLHGVEYDPTYNWNTSTGAVISSKVGDSKAYGIYTTDGFTIGAESSGSISITTDDVDGSCFGIYNKSTSTAVTMLAGNISIISGSSDGSKSSYESYGVYSNYKVIIGSEYDGPILDVKSGSSYTESCGIYAFGGIDINGGDATVKSGHAYKYSDGCLANKATVSISGGKLDSSATSTEVGMSTGVCANQLDITGGEVIAKGGINEAKQTAGFYINYDINITGGKITAEGGTTSGDVSFGINSWRGDILIDNATVIAKGGVGSYSIGICAERGASGGTCAGGDITICNGAKVYASTNDDDLIAVYSYAFNVGKNLLIEGNETYVEAIAGRVNNTRYTIREKRSFGIYMNPETITDDWNHTNFGCEYNDYSETHTFKITGGTLIAKTLDSDNGTIEGSSSPHASYAVVFRGVDEIEFSDDNQSNSMWYQWKTSESDEFTRSLFATYPDAASNYSATDYLHIEKTQYVKKVTFKVVNGTWADGTQADIVINVPLYDAYGTPAQNGSGVLNNIPTGMIANDNHENGSWDNEPTSFVNGTEEVTFTYIFAKKTSLMPDSPSDSDGEKDDATNEAPKTGDKTNIGLLCIIFLITLISFVLIMNNYRKGNSKK